MLRCWAVSFLFFGLMNITAIFSHCIFYNIDAEKTKLFWTLDVICTSIASYYLAIAACTDYYDVSNLSVLYASYIPLCIWAGFHTSYNDYPYWAEYLYIAVLGKYTYANSYIL